MAKKKSVAKEMSDSLSSLLGTRVRVTGTPGKSLPRRVFGETATAMVDALREDLKAMPQSARVACVDIVVTDSEKRLVPRANRGRHLGKYRIDCGRGSREAPITAEAVSRALSIESGEDIVREIVDAAVHEVESGVEADAAMLERLADINTEFARTCMALSF